jgi:hypothetical protein
VAVLVVFALGRASAPSSSSGAASPSAAIPKVGPSRAVRGVPVGYAHTRAGALAAALNYSAVLVRPNVTFDAAQLRSMFSAVATPALTRGLMAEYAPIARRVAGTPLVRGIRAGAPLLARGVPIAYRFGQVSRDRVTVQLWTVSLLGAQGLSPRASWQRLSLPLGWVNGDWKYVEAATRKAGPTPRLAAHQRPTATSTFIAQVQGLRGFRYAP